MKKIFYLTLFWMIAVFAVANMAYAVFPYPPDQAWCGTGIFHGKTGMLAIFLRWDAMHYLNIAHSGYEGVMKPYALHAFFPLFPLLVKFGSQLFTPLTTNALSQYLLAGLSINFISIFFSFVFMKAMYEADFGPKNSLLPVMLALAWPWSYYYAAPYTEALFLFFTTASFLAARKSKWMFAGLLAAFGSATRDQGLLLFPCLVIEYLHQKEWKIRNIRADILWLAFAPAGFISYLLYLGGIQGYIRAHSAWQQRVLNLNIFVPVWNYFKSLFSGQWPTADYSPLYKINDTMSVLAIALVVGLWVYARKRLRPGYQAYILFSLTMPLVTTVLQAVGRFYAVIFPVFFAGALLCEKRQGILYVVLLVFGMCSALFIALFTTGRWVA